MAQSAKTNSSRELALARRRAMSAGGKAGLPQSQQQATRSAPAPSSPPAPRAAPARPRSTGGAASSSSTARTAALARRKAMSSRGKQAVSSSDRVRTAEEVAKSVAKASAPAKKDGDCGCGCKGRTETAATEAAPRERAATPATRSNRIRNNRKPIVAQNPSKAAALARRKAQSTRGKAGISASGMTEAQTARAANPQLSGRELARALRDQRSRRGSAGQKKSAPTGRQRKKQVEGGAAKDQPWKVGASQTTHDQTVTGTMVGRDAAVTGNEPSTCRTITGTEYMGADVFREFCQAEPAKGLSKVAQSPTARGTTVTGNEVGRSEKVTGDEPGTCKNVTGTEYVSANQSQAFCGSEAKAGPSKVTGVETTKGKSVTGSNVGRSEKVTGDEPGMGRSLTGTQYTKPSDIGAAPTKVGSSNTLRGGAVTGTMTGRSEKVTGDEPGSCRNITGDDYVGAEQYQTFCEATPKATDRKVGVSQTLKGETVTGTLTDRAGLVTGNEPGSCKAVTGTPYAGAEQTENFCQAEDAALVSMRTQPARKAGMPMTGIQPGVGGVMTGADKGACETVSGTPYVGSDQVAEACPAMAAEPGAPDFPQPVGEAPWGDFSVEPPIHASDVAAGTSAVTGSQYERGQITGPFGMAPGKVTGTEEARFGRDARRADMVPPPAQEEIDGRTKSRITGEGQDAGSKITGDDWERGDHVTGTEGASAMVRNPSRRGGPMTAMGARASEPAEAPTPVSRVTGSSGSTESGSLITYSGGARG